MFRDLRLFAFVLVEPPFGQLALGLGLTLVGLAAAEGGAVLRGARLVGGLGLRLACLVQIDDLGHRLRLLARMMPQPRRLSSAAGNSPRPRWFSERKGFGDAALARVGAPGAWTSAVNRTQGRHIP